MSWKMFGQIVLLILITAIILCATKYCLYQTCGFKGKPLPVAPRTVQK